MEPPTNSPGTSKYDSHPPRAIESVALLNSCIAEGASGRSKQAYFFPYSIKTQKGKERKLLGFAKNFDDNSHENSCES